MVFCKEFVTSPEQPFMLLKNQVRVSSPSTPSAYNQTSGLTQGRKNYLYNEIQQFCKRGTEDLVAPAQSNWTELFPVR